MLDRLNQLHFGSDGKRSEVEILKLILKSHEWSQYVANWAVVLEALRTLWKLGKVSQLKTPFYDPFEKVTNK